MEHETCHLLHRASGAGGAEPFGKHRPGSASYSEANHQIVREAEMNYLLLLQTVGLLGLRIRYWIIIIVVVLVLIALAYMARGRRV